MPDSSGFGKPPSRTLLLSLSGLPDRPTSLRTIHHRSLAHLHTRSLTQSYAAESHNNSLNCDNSRNYINPRNIFVNLNTISKWLYLIIETRLLSSRMHAQLTNSPLPPQEATTASIPYDGAQWATFVGGEVTTRPSTPAIQVNHPCQRWLRHA